MYRAALSAAAAVVIGAGQARAVDLSVVSISPTINAQASTFTPPIVVDFDRPVNPATVNSQTFSVYGRWSGVIPGSFTFSNANQRVTFTPSRSYTAGDPVYVNLARPLAAADASLLRSTGFAWQFRIKALAANMVFTHLDTLSSHAFPGDHTRIYGATASDLDADGWMDLSVVSEDSHDVRVFMNTDNSTGLYNAFLQPVNPVGGSASPNEPADFNRDGKMDLATANVDTASISVMFGNGDGTYLPRTDYAVGDGPHGLAVLDADGDGDLDIATSNTGAGNVTVRFNNGSGLFTTSTSFEGGGNGEYAIGAADFNNDFITDLVVGARFSSEAIIHLGNGNGTFTPQTPTSAGGNIWMLCVGDVNNDGRMDVAASNSSSNNCAILLNNGTGTLNPPVVTNLNAGAIATDLGDLDGDGDLDWVLSCFSGGVWRVLKNNGAGAFTIDQSFNAPSNPSCAIILDFDNDRDLDLALTDEIADLVVLMKNSSTPPPACAADANNDNLINGADLSVLLSQFGSTVTPGTGADFNNDGLVNGADLSVLLGLFGTTC